MLCCEPLVNSSISPVRARARANQPERQTAETSCLLKPSRDNLLPYRATIASLSGLSLSPSIKIKIKIKPTPGHVDTLFRYILGYIAVVRMLSLLFYFYFLPSPFANIEISRRGASQLVS